MTLTIVISILYLVSIFFILGFIITIEKGYIEKIDNLKEDFNSLKHDFKEEKNYLQSQITQINYQKYVDDNTQKIKELQRLLGADGYNIFNSDGNVYLDFYEEDTTILHSGNHFLRTIKMVDLYKFNDLLNEYKSICCNKRKRK